MSTLLSLRRWLAKPRRQPNPYTCRLARRCEFFALWMMRKHPYWSSEGYLCVRGVEFRTMFPARFYEGDAWIQNRFPTTRFILSA